MNKNFKPYYAVIFTSTHPTDIGAEDLKLYKQMAMAMEDLAKQQNGYLGLCSARNTIGITISYWKNLDAIAQWKANTKHLLAQQKGRKQWYSWYKVSVCKVEREYEFFKN